MRTTRHQPGSAAANGQTRQLALLVAVILLAATSCRSVPEQGKSDVVSGASLAGGDSPAAAGEESQVDGGPRVLVVFFSQGNSTKRVAEDIAALLGADVERIVEKNDRR